jgi:hypothetical protein
MTTIDIDFEVYKALTSLRAAEEITYNAVLRDILKLPPVPTAVPIEGAGAPGRAWTWKGTTLPHGTQLKAEYKGQEHMAEIVDGQWLLDGITYGSPSAAGHSITGSGINGWWFWFAKKPGEVGWTVLSKLRPGDGVQ